MDFLRGTAAPAVLLVLLLLIHLSFLMNEIETFTDLH